MIEVNLLVEYTDENGIAEFFMEPGEEYELGNALWLKPGTYLAKIVFVGAEPSEYWGRILPIHV